MPFPMAKPSCASWRSAACVRPRPKRLLVGSRRCISHDADPKVTQGSIPTFVATSVMATTRSLLLGTLLLVAAPSFAQKRIVQENLANFDLHRFHFGFLLSYNTSDFFVKLKPQASFQDSLMVLNH